MKLSSSMLFGALLTLVAASAPAQQPDVQAPGPYEVAASDVASPDAIIRALYDVISGPAGARNWDRMRSLFDPKALMAAIYRDRQGQLHHVTFSVDDYIKTDTPYFLANPFFEREVHRVINQYGAIADVFSTYESRHKATDRRPFESGINDLQLYEDHGRWWILSINWQGTDSGVQVPAKYR